MRDDLVAEKPLPLVVTKQRPEPKHMTAKPQATLDFEESGQVRVSAVPKSDPTTNSRVQNRPLENRNMTALTDLTASETKPASAPQPVGRIAKDKNDIGSALSSPASMAKESTLKGDVSGTVVDPSGAVVANAKVTAGGPIGTKTATSDPNGNFSFDALPPGSYSIKAEAPGFQTREIKQLAVLENKNLAMRVTLQPGSDAQTVEVSAAALGMDEAVVSTTTAEVPDAPNDSVTKLKQGASLQKAPATATSRQAGIGSGAESPQLQWSLSPNGTVQRSDNGGRTWQSVSVATGTTFRALSGMGANIWAGGTAGALYHSVN